MNEQITPDQARKQNASLALMVRADRTEVDQVTSDLREQARRNHFAERIELAFRRREHA